MDRVRPSCLHVRATCEALSQSSSVVDGTRAELENHSEHADHFSRQGDRALALALALSDASSARDSREHTPPPARRAHVPGQTVS